MPITIKEKPHKKVWRMVKDENLQQVFQCNNRACVHRVTYQIYNVKEIAGKKIPKCSHCGKPITYLWTEIGE